ncbi:MAG: hypothetical protein ACI9IL_000832 [Rickettsiales bacterium]
MHLALIPQIKEILTIHLLLAQIDIDLRVNRIIGISGLDPYISDIVTPLAYIEIILSSQLLAIATSYLKIIF